MQEITEWPGNTPNHIYIVNNAGTLVGYVRAKDNKKIKLNTPMKRFETRYRKFKTLRNFDLTFFERKS